MININKVTLFCITAFLTILTTYISRAPQNIATSILAVFSFIMFMQNKEAYFEFYNKNKLFFFSLILFFLTYSAVSFIHFGFDMELIYALKRNRWALYALFIIPSAVFALDYKKTQHDRASSFFVFTFYSFSLLFSIIFVSEILKVFFDISSVQELLTSDVYKIRASWTFNPIPFSKLSFFGVLMMTFFAAKLSGKYSKILACVQIIIMLLLMALSQTRASWLGAMIALAFMVYILGVHRKFKLVLAGFLSLFVLVISFTSFPFMSSRFLSSFSSNSFSNSYRIEHWVANSKLIADNFWLGVGNNRNRLETVISPYLREETLLKYTSDKLMIFNGPHNEYLDVGAGGGAISLMFLMLCFFVPVLKLFNSLKSRYNLLATLSLGYLVFIYFTLVFDKISYTNWATVVCCWVIAYIIDDDNLEKNKIGVV